MPESRQKEQVASQKEEVVEKKEPKEQKEEEIVVDVKVAPEQISLPAENPDK